MNDPAFRRYQHWADRRMEDLVRRMQERLKRIKPEVALVTWTTNAGRFGHFLSIPRNMPARMNLLLDAPDQEFWLDETNRGTTIVPAFANAYIWATHQPPDGLQRAVSSSATATPTARTASRRRRSSAGCC